MKTILAILLILSQMHVMAQSITNGEVFDFQPGDVFLYQDTYFPELPDGDHYVQVEYLTRTENATGITYNYREAHGETEDFSSDSIVWDTLTINYQKFDYVCTFNTDLELTAVTADPIYDQISWDCIYSYYGLDIDTCDIDWDSLNLIANFLHVVTQNMDEMNDLEVMGSGNRQVFSDIGSIMERDGYKTVSMLQDYHMDFAQGLGQIYDYSYISSIGAAPSSHTRELISFSKNGINHTTLVSEIAEKSTISLYPNPATNFINIAGSKPSAFKVFDINGRELTRGISQQIDISSFSPGMYFVKIGGETTRIIKQ